MVTSAWGWGEEGDLHFFQFHIFASYFCYITRVIGGWHGVGAETPPFNPPLALAGTKAYKSRSGGQ